MMLINGINQLGNQNLELINNLMIHPDEKLEL